MIRVTDPATVNTLAEDFALTERGERQSLKGHIITNAEIEPVFKDTINGAARSLVLASPYSLDIGIVQLLEQAQAPDKTVVTARENNFRLLRAAEPYIWDRLIRGGVELRTYPDFFHARFPAGRRRPAAGGVIELQPAQLPLQPGGLPADHRHRVHRRVQEPDAGRHRAFGGGPSGAPQPRRSCLGQGGGPLLLPRDRRGPPRSSPPSPPHAPAADPPGARPSRTGLREAVPHGIDVDGGSVGWNCRHLGEGDCVGGGWVTD